MKDKKDLAHNAEIMQVLALVLVGGMILITGCGEVTQRAYRVVRVIDGDTFRVHYDGEETSVRLEGCDAPERNEPGGREAADFVRALIDGKMVRLRFVAGQRKRDNFGRLLCRVEIGGEDLADLLIQQHLATTWGE